MSTRRSELNDVAKGGSTVGHGRGAESHANRTQSIESDAAVATVVGLLADPTHLLKWAPAFADSISGDTASGWRATKDGRDFSLRVAVNHEAGTVDYRREIAPGREGGAYIRVIPRPRGGSVIVMTLPLLPDVDPADTATRLGRELIALVSLVEER
ncbi:MAG: SRPBCC family protein [Actinomycetota bacterium]|nr:SRPBCC family protein [Actinomycetota bacterium]